MAQRDPDPVRLNVTAGKWFSWSATVQPAKGTAGGSLRVAFPFKANLAIALACLVVAAGMLKVGAFFIAPLFCIFGAYHAVLWWRGSPLPRAFAEQVGRNVEAIRARDGLGVAQEVSPRGRSVGNRAK